MIDITYPDIENDPKKKINPQSNQGTNIFDENAFLQTLQPETINTYLPQAQEQADNIFTQSILAYENAAPRQSIIDKNQKVMDYFKTNYPDQNKAINEIDGKMKAGIMARALSDLSSAIGSAAGNTGGRAGVQRENYSRLDNDINNYKSLIREKGNNDYNRSIAEFNAYLNTMGKQEQELLERDINKLKYATDNKQKFLADNKMTYGNKAYMNALKMANDNNQKNLDRKIRKEIADRNNATQITTTNARIKAYKGKSNQPKEEDILNNNMYEALIGISNGQDKWWNKNATWSDENKEIMLYLDGKPPKDNKEIGQIIRNIKIKYPKLYDYLYGKSIRDNFIFDNGEELIEE